MEIQFGYEARVDLKPNKRDDGKNMSVSWKTIPKCDESEGNQQMAEGNVVLI